MLAEIIEGVFELIAEIFIRIFGFFFYHTGLLILKVLNYNTDNIMKYQFLGKDESDGKEYISYRFPVKIGVTFWLFIVIVTIVLLTAC
jgi:hypothetical protein